MGGFEPISDRLFDLSISFSGIHAYSSLQKLFQIPSKVTYMLES